MIVGGNYGANIAECLHYKKVVYSAGMKYSPIFNCGGSGIECLLHKLHDSTPVDRIPARDEHTYHFREYIGMSVNKGQPTYRVAFTNISTTCR